MRWNPALRQLYIHAVREKCRDLAEKCGASACSVLCQVVTTKLKYNSLFFWIHRFVQWESHTVFLFSGECADILKQDIRQSWLRGNERTVKPFPLLFTCVKDLSLIFASSVFPVYKKNVLPEVRLQAGIFFVVYTTAQYSNLGGKSVVYLHRLAAMTRTPGRHTVLKRPRLFNNKRTRARAHRNKNYIFLLMQSGNLRNKFVRVWWGPAGNTRWRLRATLTASSVTHSSTA